MTQDTLTQTGSLSIPPIPGAEGDSGYADSNGFALNTTDTGAEGDSGYADSNGFALNTTDTGAEGDSGYADSNAFALNTTDTGAEGDSGYADSNGFALDTTDKNQAPQFQTDGNFTVLENTTFIFEFNATDADGDTLSYSFQSGADMQLFELNATSGILSFQTPKDFENPEDNNTDNVYELTVSVSDDNTSATLNVFVRVLDQSYEPSKTNHFVESASGLEMIWVEPGTFTMGSPVDESGRSTDETQYDVTITRGFYLSKFEITQGQYLAVMDGNAEGISVNPSQAQGHNRPVEMVSWNDLQVFIARLNEIEANAGRLPEGMAYGLPTEAEWEYACRAGSTSVYSWGDTFDTSNANYTGTNIGTTTDVGSYDPNAWGFYDMHGNVWELCADWYGTYPSEAVNNPTGPSNGSTKIKRGGSFIKNGSFMRSASRGSEGENNKNGGVGFRLAYYPEAIPNNPPIDLNFTGSLAFNENLPIGTTLAEFNASDPDGDSITYNLVDENGSTKNNLFTLEQNGTLKTAVLFDYEANASSYLIRVQAKDESNASIEKEFTLTLQNVDDTAPVITLLNDSNITHEAGSGICRCGTIME